MRKIKHLQISIEGSHCSLSLEKQGISKVGFAGLGEKNLRNE